MTDTGPTLAIIKEVINTCPIKNIPIDIAYRQEDKLWSLIIEGENTRHLSVEDNVKLYTWAMNASRVLHEQFEINAQWVRR